MCEYCDANEGILKNRYTPNEAELVILQKSIRNKLQKSLKTDVDVSVYYDVIRTEMVADASWETMAVEAQDSVQVPSDWFQHLKESMAPDWLKRLFPVRYDKYHAYLVLPDIDIPDKMMDKSYYELKKR